MIITKKYSNSYEVKFYPNAFSGYKWEQFRTARERVRQSTKKLSKCFICGREFQDDDQLIFITVSGKGNMFSCVHCYEEHKDE